MAKRDYSVTADWREVDTTTLPSGLAALYAEYKSISAAARQAKLTFEEAFAEMAADVTPKGERIAFGHNFGKLSIAMIPDDRPVRKPTAAKAPLNFADWGARPQ